MKLHMRRVLVLAVLMAGTALLRAQEVDMNTGFSVDPAYDPSDYMALQTGGTTNAALEALAASDKDDALQAQQQAAMQALSDSSQHADDDDNSGPAVPVTPRLPKPTVSPKAGKYQGPVAVTVADAISGATFHYTLDGSKPTDKSTTYLGMIEVTGTEKLRVIAESPAYVASSVKTAKYKVEPPKS